MKFKFKNIGPVKKADLELGDLTIIAGANNTGKTYIVYTLYGLLGSLLSLRIHPIHSNFSREIESAIRPLDKQTDEGSEVREVKVTIKQDKLKECLINYLDKHVRMFSKHGVAETFASTEDQFSNASITLARSAIKDLIDKKWHDFWKKRASSQRNLSLANGYIEITYASATPIPFRKSEVRERRVRYQARGALTHDIGEAVIALVKEIFPDPFILSAERFGISLFYKELDFTKSRLVEAIQKMDAKEHKSTDEERLPFLLLRKYSARYAQPIKDNIDFTRGLEDLQKQPSELNTEKFFDDIKDMMGGYYKYADKELQFRSKARGENSFKIPLHLASSSVRGLSDLYFYLKHIAKKGQLLIIDEPESHLDTANQIVFARMLARCVNAGIKVLITTHSDYIVKELNNLIMLSNDFKEKDEFLKTFKYSESEALRPDAVKAYTCEKGQLSACKIDKYGMVMKFFDKTINSINKTANALVTRLYED